MAVIKIHVYLWGADPFSGTALPIMSIPDDLIVLKMKNDPISVNN